MSIACGGSSLFNLHQREVVDFLSLHFMSLSRIVDRKSYIQRELTRP